MLTVIDLYSLFADVFRSMEGVTKFTYHTDSRRSVIAGAQGEV